ncbi:hypothetical protein BD414DRAFT_405085, partial [Trametes punicea]
VLIVAFGLMWFALLIGWRALQQRGFDTNLDAGTDLASASTRAGRAGAAREGFAEQRRPYPCSSDSVYCVVEEWTYW